MVREWPFIEYVVRESRRTHLRRTSTYYTPGQLQPQHPSLHHAQWLFLFNIVQKLWDLLANQTKSGLISEGFPLWLNLIPTGLCHVITDIDSTLGR